MASPPQLDNPVPLGNQHNLCCQLQGENILFFPTPGFFKVLWEGMIVFCCTDFFSVH